MATLGAEFWVPLLISTAASTAGTVMQVQGAKQQAKQEELNAEAQVKALAMEQQRQAGELETNRDRMAVAERRERAALLAQDANSGFMTGTGTSLSLMSTTKQGQDERRADMVNSGNLGIWQLGTQGATITQEARSQAAALRGGTGATLLSGLSQTVNTGYGMYSGAASRAKPKTP